MRFLSTLAVLVALVAFTGVHAQQSRSSAQAAGSSLANDLLQSGSISPNTSIQTGGQQGSTNVWGSAYTGTADPTLTGKQSSDSMVGLGNQARTDASTSFKGYTQSRMDQASQATYFLDKNPVLKPTLSSSDPLFSTSNLNATDIFASSSNTVCTQQTVATHQDNRETYTCTQTYNPYVVSCSTSTQVISNGSQLSCVSTRFSCFSGSGDCCAITLSCNGDGSGVITYQDCCGYSYNVYIASAQQLINGVTINPAGASLVCNSSGGCTENMVDYYCSNPAAPIASYPGANSFSVGIKKLFTTVQTNNCSALEGLAAP